MTSDIGSNMSTFVIEMVGDLTQEFVDRMGSGSRIARSSTREDDDGPV